jgi:uncharacterized protein (TIGR03067 family)
LRIQANAGGIVDKQLPARPDLDHLRGQAKTLLSELEAGNAAAVRAFTEHLPAARGMKPAALRKAKFRLADAQSVIARKSGFDSWPVLARHVEQLRSLEGEWRIARLEIDGNAVPPAVVESSRILIDGDRFRTESPEATYEGIFTIDTEASPPHFDIHFVAGPEAGQWSYGIFRLEGPDELTLCLGLVHSSRPSAFATSQGCGHALEHLKRTSKARPANVTGGTPPPPVEARPIVREEPSAFEVAITPLLERLQGSWTAVELVAAGRPMPEPWLAHAVRSMTGNEVKVVVGGQTMVHAKVRIDESATPIAVDYYSLLGDQKGTVSYGIMEWIGDEVRFLMAPAGSPRPAAFDSPSKGTLSRWRRK